MKRKNNCVKINGWFIIIIVFLFVVISVRILYIAVSPTVHGVDLKQMAINKKAASKKIKANRGTIYDSLGEVLAQDVSSYTLIAYLSESRTSDITRPRHVIDKVGTARKLSEVLDISEEYLLERLSLEGLYQVEFGSSAKGLTELKKQEIEALELPGIDFIPTTKRDYPYGDFASYIIGYARTNENDEMNGEMGIEIKYNDKLKGKDGTVYYEKDAYGYPIANTPQEIHPATEGFDIHLTIDSNIQMYLENAILEINKSNPDWATFTILDAKTGAVVGSSSSPSFNPNVLKITNYNNPLTSFEYEPGSTMKIFSYMAAMEEGYYDEEETYKSGSILVDKYSISDWNRLGWGDITYDTGFTYSSNVAAVKLAQRVGKDRLTEFYKDLGFASKTGIELPGEYSGKLSLVADSELASASYGQGLTTTPIQNLKAMTALTNNGTVLKPYIISKIVDPNTNEVVYEGKREELKKVAKKETIEKLIELMDETVNGEDSRRTGAAYQTDATTLIGKTGTSNYIENGRYVGGGNKNIRSFLGAFPKEDPEYIIYVSAKDFNNTTRVLSSIVKSVVESIAKYKNLDLRDNDTDISKIVTLSNYLNKDIEKVKKALIDKNLTPIVIGNGNKVINQFPKDDTSVISTSKVFLVTNSSDQVMPDIIGWKSSEVKTLANLMNIPYNITGFGNVLSSSIEVGEEITKESYLEIILDERSV